MSSAYWVLSKFFSSLIFEPETSSSSTTVPQSADDSEVSESDEESESKSEKPSFVFKFEYQTSGILKALEKVDEIGEYVVVKPSVVEKEETGFSLDQLGHEQIAHQGFGGALLNEVEEGFSFDEEKVARGFRDDEVKCGTTSLSSDEIVSTSCEDIDSLECDSGSTCFKDEIVDLETDVHREISHEKYDGGADEKVGTSHEDELLLEEDISGLESESGSICSSLDDERGDFDDVDEDIEEQFKEIEELCKTDDQNVNEEQNALGDDSDELEDSNILHRTWEHQELLQQLKMELKKVKGTGLPTIPEESEYSDMNDSVPSKIEKQYQHGDKLSVLHRFHKRYRERMRKFDKLNSQKLFEIGVLQSKYPLESFSPCKKSATLDIKSFLDNFRLCRPKVESDGIDKIIRDVYRKLEVVYVGQLCLSWEFLHWQYDKALELLESDPSGIRSYNEFAGELQQFQVLLQRFVEDEHYRGPRTENYVKTRRAMHNLLQVPAIREDRLKQGKNGNAITIDIVVETLRESIRTIWQFIQADKTASTTIACRKRTLDESCLHPKLLEEVQAELKNKQKKLKEILRSDNRIQKRFQKHEDEEERDEEHEEEEDNADHHHHRFFTQVDIKIVSRVLNMPTLTHDQLIWCQNKLSKIHIMKRQVHVDPFLLLFPY